MKLSRKLMGSFLLVVSFCVAVGLIGIVTMGTLSGRIQSSYDQGVLPLQTISKTLEAFMSIQVNLRDCFNTTLRGTAISNIRQIRPKLDGYLEEYRLSLNSDDEKGAYEDFRALFDKDYVPTLDKTMELLNSQKNDEAYALLTATLSVQSERLSAKLSRMVNEERLTMRRLTETSLAETANAIVGISALAGFAALLSIAIGLLISRGISRSLSATNGIAALISRGDLSIRTVIPGLGRRD